MAKKDNENFNFDTESEGKGKFDLVGFFKNLTKQQRGIILIAAVAVVLVIAIIVTCVIIGGNGSSNNNENNNSNVNDNGLPTDITGFVISNLPIKTVYYVGAEPDYTGMSLYIRSSSGTLIINYMEQPDSFKVTGFDSSVPVEKQTITVEYEGFTDTFTIKVIEVPVAAPTLVAIRLDPNNMPVDTCKLGYAPDIRGAKLVCEYSDGTTKVINLAYEHLSDFEEDLMAAQVGDTVTIPVVYDEDGYVAETSFTVTIVE